MAAAREGGAVFLAEPGDHLGRLEDLLSAAAVCIGHRICELWTADRDFGYFPTLRTRNPLVG